MIISPQSLDTNLSQLLAEVKSGSMQLPEFQRDWTWDDSRIRGIIASLSQGYPMGAIMRLQYGNPDIQFKYRTITGVKGVSVKPEHLILDGQQRLTSIYQATSSKEPVSTKTEKGKAIKRYYYLSMERCLDDDEDRFDAVLSIPEDRKIKENFDRDVKLDLSTREYEYENKLFPVNIVFDSNAVMDWFMGYMTHYGMKPEAMDEFKRFQADVLNTISGYKLPVITLDKSTPREAVCKVFENVNTGGVPLTVFELVTATYATRDFDLRKDWLQCRNSICGFGDTLRTDLFDGIDETTFLTTVCLYTSYLNKQSGKTNTISCKKKDVLGLPYESYIANRDAVLSGFKIAKEFLLRDQCVFRQRDLPYTTQLIPLAAISSTRLLTLQTRLSAAYKGIMALLYKEKCRDFMNNTTIDIVNSMLESPDIHHIFPEAYCEKMGIKRERYNSIINKTPILPATNRSIGGNAPSEYLGAILKKVDGLTENELQARVESHFINYAELKADDFNGYFIDRAKSLLNLIEKAMNKPVTDRDAENTLDQFGASLA